jgi:hypothetical protein
VAAPRKRALSRPHGATQRQRWTHGPKGLGRDQGGTCICSVASSVAERRVGYRQHAVGCADGWAGEERAKRVLRLSCHSQGHLRKARRKSYLIRAQAFRRQAKGISTTATRLTTLVCIHSFPTEDPCLPPVRRSYGKVKIFIRWSDSPHVLVVTSCPPWDSRQACGIGAVARSAQASCPRLNII